jgi:hypothetical protein
MPASQATVQTGNPGRYLTQLCQHASKMGRSRLHRPRSHADGGEPPEIRHAEWSATDGTVTLNWGQWTMHAAPGTLTLRAEAGTGENLRRIQDLVTARLEKIGRRDHLAVDWQPAETPGGAGLLPVTRRARRPTAPWPACQAVPADRRVRDSKCQLDRPRAGRPPPVRTPSRPRSRNGAGCGAPSHAARYLSDPVYRRKISRQLSKGESPRALRRDLRYARQGRRRP